MTFTNNGTVQGGTVWAVKVVAALNALNVLTKQPVAKKLTMDATQCQPQKDTKYVKTVNSSESLYVNARNVFVLCQLKCSSSLHSVH